jgi:CheY-like chemotaxis protein
MGIKMKIMIVEDDETLAGEIGSFLERWGYEAVRVQQFGDIRQEFIKSSPQLVLMDVNLPFYDGFYWCSQIRKVSSVPVIYISSRNDDRDKIMGIAQGGDEVGVDVGHEELCEHAEGEHTDDAQSEEHQKNFPDEAQNRKFLLFLAGRGPGGAARTAGDGLIHRWRYLLTDKNCSQGRREDGRTGSFERGNAPSGTPVWSAKI